MSNSSLFNSRIASLGLPSNFLQPQMGNPMTVGVKAQQGRILYFSGMIAVCAFIGFAAVKVSSNLSGEQTVAAPAKSTVHAPTSISVRVIDGDTISLDDGRPNVRLVGFNAPETGNRARCEAERQKGESAETEASRTCRYWPS